MPIVLPFENVSPALAPDVYLADNAVVIGDVVIESGASVWFGAVLRGDVGPIRVGARTNIQDLCMVHTSKGLSRAELGCDVTVGHGCVLHGCRIGDRVLVGMGSILLDNVVVGEDSLIAAGSLLTARMVVPPRSLVMGRPARVRRELEPGELEAGLRGAQRYVGLAQEYLRARGGG